MFWFNHLLESQELINKEIQKMYNYRTTLSKRNTSFRLSKNDVDEMVRDFMYKHGKAVPSSDVPILVEIPISYNSLDGVNKEGNALEVSYSEDL